MLIGVQGSGQLAGRIREYADVGVRHLSVSPAVEEDGFLDQSALLYDVTTAARSAA